MAWHPAPGCESLEEGKGTKVEVDQAALAVFKYQGAFWAVQDFCPHRGGSLGAGDLDQAGWVACPLHSWFFNIQSGASSQSPLMSIKTFACKLEQGKVWVDLPPVQERKIP